jgi:hypothetical protein
MKDKQDSSTSRLLTYNLHQPFDKYNKKMSGTFSSKTEPDFILTLRDFAKKESLSNKDLYKITEIIITSHADITYFNNHSRHRYYNDNQAYKELIDDLIKQIGEDTLDLFKKLREVKFFKKSIFDELISNPSFNTIKEVVLKVKKIETYKIRHKKIAIILDTARTGIFSDETFDEKVVFSMMKEFYSWGELDETVLSKNLIENYLSTIGLFNLDFKKGVTFYIEKAVFCVKIFNLIHERDFLNLEIITSLMPYDSYSNYYYYSPRPLYIILNYLNENKLLNNDNYNFFKSLSTKNQERIAKLIESKSFDGDELSPLDIIEMIKGHEEETLRDINDIFEWLFKNNPGLLKQPNIAKILSHKNIESLHLVFNSLYKINNIFERNSLNGCNLIRLSDAPSENIETLKKMSNSNPIYALIDCNIDDIIYYIDNTFSITLPLRKYSEKINQIFPKNIGEFCLATTQNLKAISSLVGKEHIQLSQAEFDDILSCPYPNEAYKVIKILEDLNMLTSERRHHVLINAHQKELCDVIRSLSRGHHFQPNEDQLNVIFERAHDLSICLYLFDHIPDHLFNDNTVNQLLNLSVEVNPSFGISAFVNELINGNVNASKKVILNTAQSTHTASVHRSISASAVRLKNRYELDLKKIGIDKILEEIKSYINSLPDDENKLVNKNSAAKRAIKTLDNEYSLWQYIEPVSKISNKEFLALAWITIHDEKTCTAPFNDSLESFIKSLYEIQRGYNLDVDGINDDGKQDKVICSSGAFNKIAQGLESIHPDIEIEYFTQTGANLKIQNSRLVFDKCLSYFKGKNLSKIQLDQLREEGFESKLFDESWTDLRKDIAEEMLEYREVFKSDKDYHEFIAASKWTLNIDELCEEIEQNILIENKENNNNEQPSDQRSQDELSISTKDQLSQKIVVLEIELPKLEEKQTIEQPSRSSQEVEADLKIQSLREKINLAILGRKSLDNCLPEENSYLGWMNINATGTRGLTRFSHWYHGDSGVRRARELLETANNPDATYEEISNHFQHVFKDSSYHKHSLSRYLVAQFNNDNFIDLEQLSDNEFEEIKSNFNLR